MTSETLNDTGRLVPPERAQLPQPAIDAGITPEEWDRYLAALNAPNADRSTPATIAIEIFKGKADAFLNPGSSGQAVKTPSPTRPLSGRLGTIADAHAKEREVENKIERATAEAGPLTREEIELGARESQKYLDHLRGNEDPSDQ